MIEAGLIGLARARSGGVKTARVLLVRLGVAATILVGLWMSLGSILAADRGIDLTDEGLYLLAAQTTSLDAVYGTPWGWHTAPLFRLVAYDIAAFRTLGAFLLVIASSLLGLALLRLPNTHRARSASDAGGRNVWFGQGWDALIAAVLGGLGGLLYYGGLLRTPSYNWVNVFGATVAALGLVIILQNVAPAVRSGRLLRGWTLVGVLVAGFGAFFTVPAKPTTPIFFAGLVVLLLTLREGWMTALKVVGAIGATASAFAGESIMAGLWSTDVVGIFLRALSMPPLADGQGLSGAVRSLSRFPFALVREPRMVLLFAVVVGCLIAAAFDHVRPSWRFERPWAPSAALLAVGVGGAFAARINPRTSCRRLD